MVIGVGFSWSTCDENKMLDSFDLGSHDLFSHFLDLQLQAEIMGYHNYSLSSLAGQLLGFAPPTSKPVCSLHSRQ